MLDESAFSGGEEAAPGGGGISFFLKARVLRVLI
jgi:hypothetical protein